MKLTLIFIIALHCSVYAILYTINAIRISSNIRMIRTHKAHIFMSIILYTIAIVLWGFLYHYSH